MVTVEMVFVVVTGFGKLVLFNVVIVEMVPVVVRVEG